MKVSTVEGIFCAMCKSIHLPIKSHSQRAKAELEGGTSHREWGILGKSQESQIPPSQNTEEIDPWNWSRGN